MTFFQWVATLLNVVSIAMSLTVMRRLRRALRPTQEVNARKTHVVIPMETYRKAAEKQEADNADVEQPQVMSRFKRAQDKCPICGSPEVSKTYPCGFVHRDPLTPLCSPTGEHLHQRCHFCSRYWIVNFSRTRTGLKRVERWAVRLVTRLK